MEITSKLYAFSKELLTLNKNVSAHIEYVDINHYHEQFKNNLNSALLLDENSLNHSKSIIEDIHGLYPNIKMIYISDDADVYQYYTLLKKGIEILPSHIFSELNGQQFINWTKHDDYRILIIDDETVDGLSYEKLLEKTGFQIKTIQTNVEIIEPIKFYHPDLLLVVLDLNDIAGDELVKLIKKVPENLSLPIFFISPNASKEIKQKILDVGACKILNKPINNEEFISTIVRKIQSNQLDLIEILPKYTRNIEKNHCRIRDIEQEKITSFIADNFNNPNASVIWLKINNKSVIQNKIGLSGFKNLHRNLIKQFPIDELEFSDMMSVCEGVYVFLNKNLNREQSLEWIDKIQQWSKDQIFSTRAKEFQVSIKPFLLKDIPNKSNKELLYYDAQRLLLNSGTNLDTVYVSEGDDQKHFYLIKTKLENAIREKSFNWQYQSILSTKSDKMEIFQLLLRVIAKNGQELKTKDYLDVANQTGLLKLLDRFTLEHAVQMIQSGQNKEIERHILVNQLIGDYESEAHLFNILEYIKSQNLPKNRLVFQFRQDMVEEHTSLIHELGKVLRNANITICLSEFDSTATAWKIARAFNVHWIRVKPFELESSTLHKNNPEYIGNIIKKAQNLGYKIMIPNIDSAGLTADIWNLNADLIQGNFIQAPVNDLKYIENQ